jgi:hypothetical protein
VNYTIDQPLKSFEKELECNCYQSQYAKHSGAHDLYLMFHFTITKYNGPPVENTPEKKPPRNPKKFIWIQFVFLYWTILCKTKVK